MIHEPFFFNWYSTNIGLDAIAYRMASKNQILIMINKKNSFQINFLDFLDKAMNQGNWWISYKMLLKIFKIISKWNRTAVVILTQHMTSNSKIHQNQRSIWYPGNASGYRGFQITEVRGLTRFHCTCVHRTIMFLLKASMIFHFRLKVCIIILKLCT